MSKISSFIVSYLQENDTLSLDSLGTFFKDQNADVIESSNKELVRPIAFEQNKKAVTDVAFIEYTKEKSGKMMSLVLSDIETYLTTGKQLLNISKPFTIDGLGTINRNEYGVLSFLRGEFTPPKIDVQTDRERKAKLKKEKPKEKAELNYETTYGKSVKKSNPLIKKILGGIAFSILLGGLGYLIYTFIFNNSNKETITTKNVKDTTNNLSKKDTIPKPNVVQLDSLGRQVFKAVVRSTDLESANKRAKQFEGSSMPQGYDTTIVEKSANSDLYHVIVYMRSRAADTATLRSMLKANYGTTGQEVYFK
jgi:hypothetical protein